MRGRGLCPEILAVIALGSAGCGDLPLCQREIFVAFGQTIIAADVDAIAPGVQTDVHIRTSLGEGELVTLEVASADGTALETHTQPAAADGSAAFLSVSVPTPRVTLRATGRGACGEGRDEIMVDVSAGADCLVQLSPEPEANDHFAPLGVLSTRSDPDPISPGHQAAVRVASRPGWTIRIFETAPVEQLLATVTAGPDGVASLPVTLLDGEAGFRATCRGAGTELASRTMQLYVDTTPPSCELVAPVPGATITQDLDANQNVADGLQLEAVGRADGSDVAGEAVTLAIGLAGEPAAEVPASDADEAGMTTAPATLLPATTPATYHFALTMRDHARNACMSVASYDVVYEGCAIAVASPTAPVTRDADASAGNGSQVDITLAVAPSCAGRSVTATCGQGALGGTVDGAGRALLRANICAASPCEAEVDCAFQVTTAVGVATQARATIVFDDMPPAAVGSLGAAAVDRQRIRLAWTAPGSAAQPIASYVLKSSPVPLTEATFDTAGTVLATAAPRAPGSAEGFDVFPARTGSAQHFAIATRDAVGNRSLVATAGPATPVFDRTDAIPPINASQGQLGLGAAIAHGKFNDDEFDDVAIGAPFQGQGPKGGVGAVYVYFGGPRGIPATPGLAITSAESDANLGAGLAALRWSRATRDDLAIGAPGADGGAGRIYVLRGGAAFGTGTREVTTADLVIRVAASRPGWFNNSALGSALASADVDGDRTVDLVASAPRGGGRGGAVILHGGTVTRNVALSDQDAAGANGAIIERFADPGAASGRRLGFYLHAVGPTLGAVDTTDDIAIAYADDYGSTADSLYLLRGNGVRPTRPGVTERPFAPGRDVRLDYATTSRTTEWGSQVASIDDQDGDGARDLVIGAYRAQGDRGQVLIVSGSIRRAGGVARTSEPGVTLTTINASSIAGRVGAAIASHGASRADIDGDGREDLFVAGLFGVSGTGFIWFGGAIPRGTLTTATAHYQIAAPQMFSFSRQRPQGFGGQARWIGDINDDGLDDLCWASPFDNAGDGGFEVLWDQR